jgi:argininosuccinate lyase
VTGRIVALAEKKGVMLHELALAEMQAVHKGITRGVYDVLSVEASVKSRRSEGGTAPANVLKEAKAWQKRLKD